MTNEYELSLLVDAIKSKMTKEKRVRGKSFLIGLPLDKLVIPSDFKYEL
jgi:hypothetical protein